MKGVLPPEVVHLSPNVWTERFWAAAAEHRLVLPRCTACATYRFPPSPFCWNCRAQDVDWVEHDGRGTVYSFTVVRHAVIPPVKAALPVVAAVVELDGTAGCRLVGNLVDCPVDQAAVDLAVRVGWYDVREGTTVAVFRPIGGE